MRKLFTATIALAGVLGMVPLAASAMPAQSAPPAVTAAVQHADWYTRGYCGPRCRYWRHRRWAREQARRRAEWRREQDWRYWHHG